VHNQAPIASRLSYCHEALRRLPLRQEGISNAHDAVLHLLLLLADQPTGPDGYKRQKLSKRKYLTREVASKRQKERMEVKI
jgi:hypothetical protein